MKRALQYYLNTFSPQSVTVARELRGFTKKELAERLGKTPAAITRIEKGDLAPDIETFFTLSRLLMVSPSFLSNKTFDAALVEPDKCHFRCLRSTSVADRRRAIRKGQAIANLLFLFKEEGVLFPEDQFIDYQKEASSVYEIEEIALQIRKDMGLNASPIDDLTAFLESHGVNIVYLSGEEYKKVDAFSTRILNVPFIFLCSDKPSSRLRFDLAHELGHLILHGEGELHTSKEEREANRFASAFLLPWMTFKEECPKRWNLKLFVDLKLRWKVSIGALLYRAKDLKVISESSYTRAVKNMNAQGIRINEPGEFPKEQSVLFAEALQLIADSVSLEFLEEKTGLLQNEIKDVLEIQGVPDKLINELQKQKASTTSKILALYPS
ncbi:XRE family transcriptional regulator [Halodesulfovibrio sp.]|jgi:Zn-dependent peptidase ImmA (M78 family)/DNA-binding XRE family transcriptional regulator|uniref:helix-turn-helix domain-containing protein n=1 Tax=Halodesulfovibrio sp. TaxID=1912772 RepID=UPI0025F62B16|nr:XRE family transcriptional regulator [Halodesulfovibrio sp.]MCT4628032.1 XRE family transcriptional regulator [Halodesulfovibrio sp.]